jgi:hypothetical protein
MDEFKGDDKSTTWDRTLVLQMAVKAVNDTAGPDGITPTLLVFGAFPRMSALDPPAPSIDSIPSKDDINQLNKCLQWQLDNHSKGLKLVKLDINKLRIIVFTDSSFANNKDYSSQIGFIIVLADDDHCNLIHWSSVKCRRITRSVIASELYAMAHGFDSACVLKDTLDKLFDKDEKGIPLIICIDSFSLYECLVKLSTTREKRLMIDLMSIRQAYERREIAEVRWIQGNKNPADSMTKHKGNKALDKIIETNKVDIQASGWVERTSVNEAGK